MSDVTVTHTGFFSRLKSAIIGIFLGILMIPGSVILMGWNEYRTVHRSRGLKEGAQTVQTVSDPSSVDSDMDQKLVHMTGLADTDEILRDNLFQIEQLAIKLSRNVEMFQWEEDKHTETRKKTGGGETSRTVYTYGKDWNSGRINSESFHNKNGHTNPNPHFRDEHKTAKRVNVGAYLLDDHLKSSISAFETLPWTDDMIVKLDPEIQDNVVIDGQYLYWSENGTQGSQDPSLGDQRIKIDFVPPVDVSFVAQQVGNSFSEFEVSNGEKLHDLYVGTFSAEQVFGKLKRENQMWAWLYRVLGLFLCVAGFSLILGPISVIADVIPFLGSLTRGAVFFVSLLMAICVSALTISFAWIAVRPLIGVPMLLVAVGSIYWLFQFGRKNKNKQLDNPYQNLGKGDGGTDDDAVEVVL